MALDSFTHNTQTFEELPSPGSYVRTGDTLPAKVEITVDHTLEGESPSIMARWDFYNVDADGLPTKDSVWIVAKGTNLLSNTEADMAYRLGALTPFFEDAATFGRLKRGEK